MSHEFYVCPFIQFNIVSKHAQGQLLKHSNYYPACIIELSVNIPENMIYFYKSDRLSNLSGTEAHAILFAYVI